MMLCRPPLPALRPFVQLIWASDETNDLGAARADRERVLPTGTMHLVFRISDSPLRLYDDEDAPVARTIGHAIVGGARAGYYVRDISTPARSVGAMLQPGASQLVVGVPSGELAERHTPLEDLWGRAADEARERLAEVASPTDQLGLFESILLARMPRLRGLHPAIADALARLATNATVTDVVKHSGYSHRCFLDMFRSAVGLAPKRFGRVIRFQRAVDTMLADRGASLTDVAFAAGYSDQPHFTRDFREFAGVSPGDYRGLAPVSGNHVPLHPRR